MLQNTIPPIFKEDKRFLMFEWASSSLFLPYFSLALF